MSAGGAHAAPWEKRVMPQTPRRRCGRCNTILAKDNTDRLCATCRAKANDDLVRPPSLPRSFWTDDHMAAALDSWHMGKVLMAYRTHPQHGRTLSQEIIAGWLNLTQAQLSRIENGRAPEELSKLMHWADTLGVPSDLLWFKLLSDRHPKPQPRRTSAQISPRRPQPPVRSRVSMTPLSKTSEQAMADVQRRTLLSGGLAALSLPAVGMDDLRHIAAALENARRYLDHEVVDYFETQIAACATDDGARGRARRCP